MSVTRLIFYRRCHDSCRVRAAQKESFLSSVCADVNNTLYFFKESISTNWAIFATNFSADISKAFGK